MKANRQGPPINIKIEAQAVENDAAARWLRGHQGLKRITEAWLRANTSFGSATKRQAELLGLGYPLQSGWMRRMDGHFIKVSAAQEFERIYHERRAKHTKRRAARRERGHDDQRRETGNVDVFHGELSPSDFQRGEETIAAGLDVGSISKPPNVDEIERARTPRGGWTRAQLAAWGVPWPPPNGWRKALERRARASEQAAFRESDDTYRRVGSQYKRWVKCEARNCGRPPWDICDDCPRC